MEGLSVICGGLGMIEEDEDGNRIFYAKGEYCLDNLKDLLRFLRRDDPQTREVFKQICKWNTVGKDIIPIIEHCQNDSSLVLNAVKVLVFLTMPVEPTSDDIPQQIDYLWGLKSLITCSHTVTVIVSLLEGPLENLESDLFTEDDWKLVQLVVTLFRNILAVQDISLQQKVCGSASEFFSLRDRFLELLFQENVMDLILVLTQHVGGSCGYFRQDNLLLVETFYYIFKGQDPELIARAYLKGLKVEDDAEATVNSLKSIMEEEKENRKRTRLANLGSQLQFSGTFTRVTMDGSKTLFKGNPCTASRDALLKDHKNHRGQSKRMLWDNGIMPSTKDNILEMLHDFANQFLSGGYNVLMQSIRDDIEKEHHAIQNSDIVIFFQVTEFVMSFQYHKLLTSKPDIEANISEASINQDADNTLFKGNICGPVAASMNESMFLLVISKWHNAFDGLKETNNYKFLSAAGSLMKIMIRMLDLVLKQSPEDSKEPLTARVLLYKLFYDQTEEGVTHFLFNLIKSFNAHRQAKSDLADLVETIHVVIRLMETLQSHGTLRVSKKLRKKRKKKASTAKEDVNEAVVDQVTIQDEVGVSGCEKSIDVSMQVKETSSDPSSDKNREEGIIIPCQPDVPETSEMDSENPRSNVPEMENKKPDNADVESENPRGNVPGTENINSDNAELESENPRSNVAEMENRNSDYANDDYGSDASSADEQLAITDEIDFKVSTLVSALANITMIQNLCWLLKFYKSNSTRTNHYIICMLRRICEDLELSPMLYQLSLLTTFHNILDEQKSSPCKEYDNIVFFLTSLVRRMLREMNTYPLLFVEVLFRKSRKECHYINCESMLPDLNNLKKEYRKQRSVSKDGDIGSSGGNGWVRRSIADALGDDEADVVLSPRGRDDQNEENPYEGKVEKDLKGAGGKDSITSMSKKGASRKEGFNNEGHTFEHESKRAYKRMKPLVPNEELEEKLKNLYEKYKNCQNCSQLIGEELNLDEVSPAQISRKLKQLGYKLPSKRRKLRTSGSNNHGEDEGELESEVNHHGSKDLEADSSRRQSLHTRKRVHAFSEDQELMIKTLFEQFKDQKRCSHMIASALDGDGTFTAAQISRKLKQLGLRVSKQKRSDSNLHLRDEDLNDFTTEGAYNSENETLLSLRKRSKKKQNIDLIEERPSQNTGDRLSGDDSDDQLLSSTLRSKKKQNIDLIEERPSQNTGDRLSGDDSDDQLLSSTLRSKKKQNIDSFEERPSQNTGDKLSGDDFDDQLLSSALRGRQGHSSEIRATESEGGSFNYEDGEAEAEVTEVGNGQQEVSVIADKVDLLQDRQLSYDGLDDDLTDFGHDATPVASQRTAMTRRKLRMVIDPDDDDD